MSHEKWAKYFTKGNIAANPKLLKLLQFCFVIPAHNGMSSFLPGVGQWTLSLPTSLREFVLCSAV
jgi:hypothetical protein